MPSVPEFTDAFIARASGNADDQAILIGKRPHQKYYIGTLYPQKYSQKSEYKNKIAPNVCWADFLLEGKGPFSLTVTVSSNLYFRTRIPLNAAGRAGQLYMTQGDLVCEERIFDPWESRTTQSDDSDRQAFVKARDNYRTTRESQEAKEDLCFIRKRFAASVEINVSLRNPLAEHSLNKQFEAFKKAFSYLGESPNWSGAVTATATPVSDGNTAIRVSWVNTYTAESLAATFFDAALKVELNEGKLVEQSCPVLAGDTKVTATASGLALDITRTTRDVLVFRPFARAQTTRDYPVQEDALSFRNVADDPGSSLDLFVKRLGENGVSVNLLKSVTNAANAIKKNSNALSALGFVSEVYARAFKKDSQWAYHQLACVVLAAGRFLQGGKDLNPLVLNVPTAGGKTEAFFGAALWCSFHEFLNERRAISIIKYPMTLLSSDQVRRISGYMMIADEIVKRKDRRGYPLALGYFVGRKGQYAGPSEIVKDCPYPTPNNKITGESYCGQEWDLSKTDYKQARCTVGHILNLYCDNPNPYGRHVVTSPPSVILGTLDKFVGGSSQKDLGVYFGGGRVYCPEHGAIAAVYDKHGKCHKWIERSAGRANRQGGYCGESLKKAKPLTAGVIVFDEGHLLRERTGSLDTHFESIFFEISRLNSGRYPIPIVSTATISGISAHMKQLGLGDGSQPNMIVLPEAEDFPSFFRQSDDLKHEVLAVVPQDVILEFAVPDLIDVYFETLSRDFGFDACDLRARNVNPIEHLRQTMVYANQYKLINHTREMIRNKINKERQERGGPPLKSIQLSRRYFQIEPMENAIKDVKEANQQIIFATSIASIGIDIENLDSIFFFGLPSNVSEFIQTLNRTGRREGKPAFCLCILGPNRPRDISYYAFWNLFIGKTNQILEPIPINRYARDAAKKTFSNVASALMLMHYGFKLKESLITANSLKQALKGGRINKAEALNILQAAYRSSSDPSHKYPDIVEELWAENFVLRLEEETHQEGDLLGDTFGDKWMFSLRDIKQEVLLEPGPSVTALKDFKTKRSAAIATRDVAVDEVGEVEDDSVDQEESE